MRGRSSRGAARIRAEPPRRATRRRTRPAPQRLGHVAGVRDPQLEEPCSARPAHPQPTESQASCDPARRADDHDDAEPHPDREPGAGGRSGGQQHERVVVARLDARGHARGDRDGRARAGREHEPRRPDGEPRRGRAAAPARGDARSAAKVEAEPGARGVDHDRLPPGFVTRIAAPADPAREMRAGVAVKPTGGRVVPAPAEAGTSTRATSARSAVRIIGRSP